MSTLIECWYLLLNQGHSYLLSLRSETRYIVPVLSPLKKRSVVEMPTIRCRLVALQTAMSLCLLLSAVPGQASSPHVTATPPAHINDLPPHVTVSSGASSVLEYRDLLLKSALSGNLATTATYRGFTLSAFGAQPFSSGRTFATELVASYSHKLPLVDFHLGAVYCRIDRPTTTECADVRVALSTNTFRTTRVDLSADVSPFGKGHIISLGLTQQIKETESWILELKGSVTSWNRNNFDANGWSVRLQGVYQINHTLGIHSHLGFLQSCVTNPGVRDESNGVIAGVNAVWAF